MFEDGTILDVSGGMVAVYCIVSDQLTGRSNQFHHRDGGGASDLLSPSIHPSSISLYGSGSRGV